MFDFIRKAVRAARQEGAPDEPLSALASTRLRRGGFVSIDTLPFEMQRERLLFVPPEGSQQIQAYGRVELGGASELHRYYLADDAWIQVNTTAGAIDEIKLWVFDDSQTPPSLAAFKTRLEAGGALGGLVMNYRDKTFRRVWGEDAAWAPPVQFAEDVYTRDDQVVEYTTVHHAMLFEREVDGTDRMEYLLVSAELSGDDYSVVYSLGVDVTLADLQVT